ncbi:substrate-specific component BioY of biotin ECF transporter [Lachnospiraceae bacterium KM106-2]|nr:substrate-specific component BioY of biotin ECF transporter [Lachnospiraceae bacterium KM106-2]
MKQQKRLSIKSISEIAIFTAVISILSQISIQLPTGVPATLQTLAIALAGFVLGSKYAAASTALYILIGTLGVPVFAGFSGGPSSLFGPTGGFLWGFIIMAYFCGIGIHSTNKIVANAIAVIGLLICHLLGAIQFSFVANTSFIASITAVSLPFILKDIASVIISYVLALQIRKALFSANLMEKDA